MNIFSPIAMNGPWLNWYNYVIFQVKLGYYTEERKMERVKMMKSKKKLLFVYNSRSGKGAVKSKLADLIDIFAQNETEITVHPTQHAKDAYETIKKKGHKYNIVIAAGGDGTLNECFNGLMEISKEKRPKFGYIPTGTTNDFASTLHISKNPLVAANGIFTGKEMECDVGKATTGYFAYVAAFGAFTNVAYDTPQEHKNMLGHMAYILEGIKSITNLESYHMKLEFQDETGYKKEIEDNFLFGMISNTKSVAGMSLGNESAIDLQDGLFEAILVKRPNNAIELQQTINALLTKDLSSERLYFFHTDAVRFSSEKQVSWTLDGEYGGYQEEMNIINLSKEINILYKPMRKRALGLLENFEKI